MLQAFGVFVYCMARSQKLRNTSAFMRRLSHISAQGFDAVLAAVTKDGAPAMISRDAMREVRHLGAPVSYPGEMELWHECCMKLKELMMRMYWPTNSSGALSQDSVSLHHYHLTTHGILCCCTRRGGARQPDCNHHNTEVPVCGCQLL